jgi:hypothetical protein
MPSNLSARSSRVSPHAFLLPLLLTSAAGAQPVERLAAIGDSITDEYFEESYDYARGWTQILVEERGLDMGPLAAGDWGEPRRTGYEDNWARYGATTDLAVSQGQHLGVVDGATNRGVSHVVVELGFNDIRPDQAAFAGIYSGIWTPTQISTWVDGRISNLDTILGALEPTGVRTVLVGAPDYTAAFLFRQIFTSVAGRSRVEQAIEDLSQAMRDLAFDRRLVFVDFFGFSQAVYGPHTAPETELLVGNVAVDLEAADTTTGSNPLAAFVDDGAHPNTIPQGILANLLIEALNVYRAAELPLSEEEILALAGVAYGGSDTLEAQLGPLSDYVENYWSLLIDGFEDETTDAWSSVQP